MVTCDSLNIIISCFSISADVGSISLNINISFLKKIQFCVFSPCEDFPNFTPSSTDNPPGSIILPAYFWPEMNKRECFH